MDLLHTGSDELVLVETQKVSIAIKGSIPYAFLNKDESHGNATIKVYCAENFNIQCSAISASKNEKNILNGNVGIYATRPLFFEQQRYELIIEANKTQSIGFWHENNRIRNKVTRASKRYNILSGVINFGNDIGLTELVVQVDGKDYLRLVLEVFPSKIEYKTDYQQIMSDVTKELYGLIFDFLRKTYMEFAIGERRSNDLVEFFTIIRKIYKDYLRSVDLILIQPHHVLESRHEIVRADKAKHSDRKTIRWLGKHPSNARYENGSLYISNALDAKKTISYNTRENQLVKFILISTIKKLKSFLESFLLLQRSTEPYIINELEMMIKELTRRCRSSFFFGVDELISMPQFSLVISMAMGYKNLYKCYLMMMRGLAINGDVFNTSIKDLATLYEYWCFIKLNSFMRERYQLLSQDIIKAQGYGLMISLVKGGKSQVRYINSNNGETYDLTYNPMAMGMPTTPQKPDNVLSLKKKGSTTQYEYIFDAKYRINPAQPGTDYSNNISSTPGPEIDDINTMHRYRDSIVYGKNLSQYEHRMVGAYVLFPYSNEEEYRQHRFYQSIGKVNIGGLPFLPSATNLVSGLLNELIEDSPDTVFERTVLPKGINEKLAKINWSIKDVLVGSLRNKEQLDICLNSHFYHIPVHKIKEDDFPIRYIAIYQSKRFFGIDAGIRYYAEVIKCVPVKRRDITEIPKNSDEEYYRFEVKQWKTLPKPIIAKERMTVRNFTNIFLLEHSAELPELWLSSKDEYRLYHELKRRLNDISINDDNNELSFVIGDSMIRFDRGDIIVFNNGKINYKCNVNDFSRSPGAVFRRINDSILGSIDS